jgi:hypothetical protein
MLNDFLIKWLFLPLSAFIIIFSLFWIYVEVRELKNLQLYYAKDIGQHVTAYLNNCRDNLSHAELHIRSADFAASAVKEVAGAQLSFNALSLLDENMITIKSVPHQSFKGDFSGLV